MPGLLCVLHSVSTGCQDSCHMCAMRPLMRCSCISAHTGTGFPAHFMFWEKRINNVENILSSCSPLQCFAKKYVFLNVPGIHIHISQKQPIAPVHWHQPIHPIEVKMIHQSWVYPPVAQLYKSPSFQFYAKRCHLTAVQFWSCLLLFYPSWSQRAQLQQDQFLSQAKWL